MIRDANELENQEPAAIQAVGSVVALAETRRKTPSEAHPIGFINWEAMRRIDAAAKAR